MRVTVDMNRINDCAQCAERYVGKEKKQEHQENVEKETYGNNRNQ